MWISVAVVLLVGILESGLLTTEFLQGELRLDRVIDHLVVWRDCWDSLVHSG